MGFAPLLATGFGLGLLPRAPGTWGSLLGLPLGIGLFNLAHAEPFCCQIAGYGNLSGWLLATAALLVLSFFSWRIICATEKSWQTHDDGRIVIDEVIGQALAIAFFPPSFWTISAGFALFRLFDILKPGPIGWADRNLPSSWGTLLDDILAGAAAAIVLGLVLLWIS
jgi:phosphatidylglycerophosphatase A